ncbi:uncharacterized protein CcaverHIS019_0503410 [Cutaneotrichosporon cavernicola]|uniref:Cleavage/polyadenylation specificity factor A subunit C-terminal domain-containing protein n=1 Tax=Cutaneotrichosporon cavernicola TaxID=279322 RepID=A0AA48L6C1_9TREE|nr:uncharacterized protein CcaverHIS019_0503410 [Cutaneotrichosporon cavernicola]BEI92713.1 hypothetical protein CcaverHIS019_0503410 [Cutaneotrichosporon cavernicola]BEJ00490.1 hypothetical protein CcaverHIS631_0503470 [Cutaneotrichosporon cavernicola]BEJ08259.1 hypothetical protein CcaverHIS641_0503440 [Cutaneotrichosporon cavernicola]
MHALYSSLLPPSAIHHSLFLPHFTPSTIYPLPKPHVALEIPEIKVRGNLIVAGGQGLRVFEIREETAAVPDQGATEDRQDGDVDVGDSFFDSAPADRAPVRFEATLRLHLLTRHTLHGVVTGLAPLRTIESGVDGLDRLLVSFKDAKMAILEWSRGDIATVSLHTYERCQQMVNGDLQGYVPMLRSDPLSRLAILTMPEDSLAILPILQEQSELDPLQDNLIHDVPYSPSFVLPLADISPTIKNLQDLLFLPGFHSPTVALLFEPTHTWAGKFRTSKDTFRLEIRTIDLSAGGSYPLLTSVTGLPADSQYLVPCPTEVGGIAIVTGNGIVHVDQGGRIVSAAVNAWWGLSTSLGTNRDSEGRKLKLEGSHAEFVGPNDMLLVLANGQTHQVRFEMDGRAVGAIKVDEATSNVPPPSTMVMAGAQGLFIGSAEGDSLLAKVELVREVIEADAKEEKKGEEMEVDWDEDLYGESAPTANGTANGTARAVLTGPANVNLIEQDRLSGIGRISAIEFGIAVTDQGTRTYPQLVALGGGSAGSTVNVFRRGIPITKKRRFDQLANANATWFLPIQRPTAQKFKDIPDNELSTILVATDTVQTRIYALSTKATQEQIKRLEEPAINVGTFFQRSSILHVSATQVVLLDQDGEEQQVVCPASDLAPIVSASISDPYVIVRRSDGSVTLFVGDSVGRTISKASLSKPLPECQAADVFTDTSGVFRTFEATERKEELHAAPSGFSQRNAQRGRTQLTGEQLKRLQESKPAIAVEAETTESAFNAARGTQWLVLLTTAGALQIRRLPDFTLVLESNGLSNSEPSFTDDIGGETDAADTEDGVRQMIMCPIGKRTVRPHLLVLHDSGRFNIYEAQSRFTLDARDQSRRSLAVRFRKVYTQLLAQTAISNLGYNIVPFADLEGLTGAFITGERPHWILASDAHPVHAYGLKQAAYAFGRTTHHGGTGEYFLRIEDGSFICYLPPTLNTDFAMPCDRYAMERTYTAIAFDPPSGHYVGASNISVPFQAYDEEGEIQEGPEGENLVPPLNERATLELFSAGSDPWRVLDGYDFDQNEAILAVQSVNLESAASPTGFRDFIAVGTGKNFGEDRASHGAVYIFEVDELVGVAPGKPGFRLRFCTKDPTRNPVSALANLGPYLIHSNGPKILAKGLDYDDRLMGLAFLDVSMYVTSLTVFKNLILVGDFVKSLVFATLQENPYKFTTVARDLTDRSLVSADLLVMEGSSAFVTSDRAGDLRLLTFDPADPDSLNGEKLILKTEFHCATPLTASKTIARRRGPEEDVAQQTQLIYATADGALTTLVTVKAARAKRLQFVQDQLVRNAPHVAGLNPRAFRSVRNDLVPRPLTKGILDGALLEHFALQPIKRQNEMMRQIGTDVVTVASDLYALSGFW